MPRNHLRSIFSAILPGVLAFALSACQSEPQKNTVSSETLGAPLTSATPSASPAIDPQVTDPDRVATGKEAPDFALEDIDNNLVRLSDYRGRKNVILVFYRGHF